MKKFMIFLLSMLLFTSSFGSTMSNPPATVILPEIMMVESGNTYVSITTYMAKHVRYPEGTDSFGLIGTTIVEFTVSTTGDLSGYTILNSITSAVDDEVIRVLKETSGNWRPGTIDGKPSNMKREVSVVFVPNKNYDLEAIAKKSQEKGDEKLIADKDPKKAERFYTRAISMIPYDQVTLASRGLAKYELGDVEGAKADWQRVAYLNDYNPAVFNFTSSQLDMAMQALSGFSSLKSMLP